MKDITVILASEATSDSEAPETFEDIAFSVRLPGDAIVQGNAYAIEVFGTMEIAWWTRDDVSLGHPHIERLVRQKVIESINAWFARREGQ